MVVGITINSLTAFSNHSEKLKRFWRIAKLLRQKIF
ncbi:hypothetical protein ES705_26946 [subsurface metagenome]